MPKSMGEAKFRTPTLPKPLNQFGWRFKYITMSAQGVNVQNLASGNRGRAPGAPPLHPLMRIVHNL